MEKRDKKILIVLLCLIVIATGTYLLMNPNIMTVYTEDKNYSYTEEDGGVVLTEYLGKHKNLIIPSEIAGKKVVGLKGTFCKNGTIQSVRISKGIEIIDYMTFFECVSLRKVEIPETVTTIGHAAFKGCAILTDVRGGNGVREIMPFAFKNCLSLKKITLPEGLLFIGEDAFQNCTVLKKLTIPGSVEVIGGVTELNSGTNVSQLGSTANTSFDGCEKLKITINPGNKFYTVDENGKIAGK